MKWAAFRRPLLPGILASISGIGLIGTSASSGVFAGEPKGQALTIGVNSLDPKHYGGWDGKLTACEFDAEDIAEIAEKSGFRVKTLKTSEATSKAVLEQLKAAAESLKTGDLFLLHYSGHGGQLPDGN